MSEATTNKKPPRLKKYYDDEVIPFLLKEFSLKNPMQVPKLEKITLNMGLGEAIQNPKALEAAAADLGADRRAEAGDHQAPSKSIATFKLREGMPIGCMVTLRRERMWEFLDRFVPTSRCPASATSAVWAASSTAAATTAVGIKEQIIFHEINYDKVDKLRGMNLTFVTTAPNDEQAKALLKQLGMPFKK
jgi:large subunit ribosomal protein L5